MARLPTINGDYDAWGTIITAYLRVAHNGDGSHKRSSAAILVVAPDAPQAVKDAADPTYVCVAGDDHAVTINAALEASRNVELSEGTFTIKTGVVIKRLGQRLVGAGVAASPTDADTGGGTLIQLDPSLADYSSLTSTYLIDMVDPAGTPGTPRGRALLRDFTLHGRSKGTTIHGMRVRAHRALLDHLLVSACTGDGIVYEGYASTNWATYDTMTRNCISAYHGGYGFKCSAVNSADMHFEHCTANNNQSGFYLAGASHQLTGIHSYSNNQYGFHVKAINSKLANCKIEHNVAAGIYFDAVTGIDVSNCNLKAGWDGTVGASQMLFANNAADITVTGCRFSAHEDGSDTAKYAFAFYDNTNIVVTGCSVSSGYQNTPPALWANGRANIIMRDCIGLPTRAAGSFTTNGTATDYTVAHGLAVTPGRKDIILTPTSDMGSGIRWWLPSTANSTNFVVRFSAAPANGLTMAWCVDSPNS